MGNQVGIIIRNVKNELFHYANRLILNEVKGIECLHIHGIIMEATVNNIQVNVMTVANAGVVKETTYQKLKRLSKKYNLQTNDPKFARV